jgi:hypothetical protein
MTEDRRNHSKNEFFADNRGMKDSRQLLQTQKSAKQEH